MVYRTESRACFKHKSKLSIKTVTKYPEQDSFDVDKTSIGQELPIGKSVILSDVNKTWEL